MDINQSLQPIVANLIEGLKISLEQELREQVSKEVVEKVANTELGTIVQDIVTNQLESRLTKFNFEATTKEQLDLILARITKQINANVIDVANKQIADELAKKIASIDINTALGQMVKSKFDHMIGSQSFPEQSIPHTSINFNGIKFTGDNIRGGIIEDFGSTGIEDRSTHVQMTIMDHAVAFESAVFAPELQVKGNMCVDGELLLRGTISDRSPALVDLVARTTQSVKANLDGQLFEGYSQLVHNKIKETGIDLNTITQDGKEIIKGNQLGYHITDSNLQRLGLVKDLQTQGETLLCDTLYTSSNRVGINTIDPTATLSIWDQEVEIVVNKLQQDTGYIGSARRQTIVLGSNNQKNLTLTPDGIVQVSSLLVGKVNMTSNFTVPNSEGEYGHIVWNENPSPGAYIGWVCLGSSRWAGFGKIE